MAQFSLIRRILAEDFDQKDQPLINKLAGILNPALESLVNALNRNLTVQENLNAQIKDLDVTVDEKGVPVIAANFKSNLNSNCSGLICIRATNTKNPSVYPLHQPFISFSENNGQILVNYVSGLQAGQKYQIRVLAIG